MIVQQSASQTSFRVPWQWTLIFFAMLMTAALIAPRSGVTLFVAGAIISTIGLWRMSALSSLKEILTPIPLIFLLFILYCAVNASWSADTDDAYSKIGLLCIVFAGTFITSRYINIAQKEELTALGYALAIAALIAVIYLLIELPSRRFIAKTIFTYIPAFRPDPSIHMGVKNGVVVGLGLGKLNKSVTSILFIVWPLVLMLPLLWKDFLPKGVHYALFTIAALIVFMSDQDAAKIAVIAGLFAFLLAQFSTRATFWLISAGWLCTFLMIVPLSHLLYQQKLHESDLLPRTGKGRVIIWHAAATNALEAPILGVGLRTSKRLYRIETNRKDAFWHPKWRTNKYEGRRYPTLHPHNNYLQTWLELGLIGAVILITLGIAVIRWISRREQAVQPYAYAMFSVFACIAMFSWGMWQSWYLYFLALLMLLFLIADRLHATKKSVY